MLFSAVDVLSGLILSYYLNVAPGGFTALVAVAVLAAVLIGKRLSRALRRTKGEDAA